MAAHRVWATWPRLAGLVVVCVLCAACQAVPLAPVAPAVPAADAAPVFEAAPPAAVGTGVDRGVQQSRGDLGADLSAVGGVMQAARAGVSRTLARYSQALRDNDTDLLSQLVDQDNPPFLRYVRHTFDLQRHEGITDAGDLTLLSLRQRPHGFLEAHIEAPAGWVADWLFRRQGGEWVLSEPSVALIGEPTETVRGHFTFSTYGWPSEANATIMELMDRARAHVGERLAQLPDTPAIVTIRPIYGLTPYERPDYLALYAAADEPPDHIIVYAPGSFHFGFYDPALGWEETMLRVLIHEYTHMVHVRSFEGAGFFNTWMREGLAQYVSDDIAPWLIADLLERDALIPIIDTVTPVYKRDLQHLRTLGEDTWAGYQLSYTLVAYIVERHGGLEGFWVLARASDTSTDLRAALEQAYGISYEEFDAGWRAWLAQHYGR